jgi:hypothetical protein
LKLVYLSLLLVTLSWCISENKLTLIYLFSASIFLVLVGAIWGHIWVVINRRRGIYPRKGQETMDDVKRLALNGNTTLAISAYRAIQGVNLKKAKQEVHKITATGSTTTL